MTTPVPVEELSKYPVVLVPALFMACVVAVGYAPKVLLCLIHWIFGERCEEPFMKVWEELYAGFWWIRKRKYEE